MNPRRNRHRFVTGAGPRLSPGLIKGVMISISFLPAVCGLLLAGCGKKSSAGGDAAAVAASNAPSDPSQPPAHPNAQAPTPAPAEPIVVPTDNNYAPVLAQLTQALRKYYFERRQVPKSFEEFAATGVVQVPPPPSGKKFAIDNRKLEVILVNR